MEPSKELDNLTNSVIGAAIEVHKHLGPGYLESVYEEALGIELTERGIPYRRQHPVSVSYKEKTVGEGKLDVLVADKLIVELKAVEALLPVHKAQVISYLKATRFHLGLLINFNVSVLRDGIQRIIYSN
ncbi:MAG TPA: GxxExxY protein [Acidiferrobacterales bacterium]|nr:GxxExxY protein [Acidiferrobacterales bacterium]